MKRSLPSIIAGAVLVVILGLYMVTYQVRENEVAVVRTFGKTAEPDPATGESPDVKTKADLYWKWPWPIQRVRVYDNRLHLSETTGEETPTDDERNVIVTTAIVWRIDDPYAFSVLNDSEADAEEALRTLVRNHQKTVISSYEFNNLIDTDPANLKYDEIEAEILAKVQEGTETTKSAKDLCGAKVEHIGIEALALPKRITENVFSAMREERNAEAARHTSAGESKADEIKAEAQAIADTILAFAQRKADAIVAEGMEEAVEYNQTFSQDEELATLLLKLEYLRKILADRTTIVIDPKPPFDLLLDSGRAVEGVTTRPADGGGVALPDMVRP